MGGAHDLSGCIGTCSFRLFGKGWNFLRKETLDEAHQPTVVIVHLVFFLPENGWNFPGNVLFLVFAQDFPETAFLFFCCLYFLQSALSFFLFVRISFKLQYQWGSMGAAEGISLKLHF